MAEEPERLHTHKKKPRSDSIHPSVHPLHVTTLFAVLVCFALYIPLPQKLQTSLHILAWKSHILNDFYKVEFGGQFTHGRCFSMSLKSFLSQPYHSNQRPLWLWAIFITIKKNLWWLGFSLVTILHYQEDWEGGIGIEIERSSSTHTPPTFTRVCTADWKQTKKTTLSFLY